MTTCITPITSHVSQDRSSGAGERRPEGGDRPAVGRVVREDESRSGSSAAARGCSALATAAAPRRAVASMKGYALYDSAMSDIFAEQFTAVANAVLAAFAIVTAILAGLAFRKQSREVQAVERQVADGQETARQQAELLKVQTGQLEVLREQLEDQRKASAAQTEVLLLQVAELRARRRALASLVLMRVEFVQPAPTNSPSDTVWESVEVNVTVRNNSSQPVYAAQLRWAKAPEGTIEPDWDYIGQIWPGEEAMRTRSFIVDVAPGASSDDICRAVIPPDVVFDDGAGVTWMRRADGELIDVEQLPGNEVRPDSTAAT